MAMNTVANLGLYIDKVSKVPNHGKYLFMCEKEAITTPILGLSLLSFPGSW